MCRCIFLWYYHRRKNSMHWLGQLYSKEHSVCASTLLLAMAFDCFKTTARKKKLKLRNTIHHHQCGCNPACSNCPASCCAVFSYMCHVLICMPHPCSPCSGSLTLSMPFFKLLVMAWRWPFPLPEWLTRGPPFLDSLVAGSLRGLSSNINKVSQTCLLSRTVSH